MIEIHVAQNIYNFGYSLRIINRDGEKISYVASALTMKPAKPGEAIPETISINQQEAEIFMNELWRAGVRPSFKKDESGALSVMKNHLDDMRRLVFKSNYEVQP
jgi:hypothetical protein